MNLVLWAACASCALLAVSGYARMARTQDGWRWRERCWYAPLIFTSAAAVLLALAGGLPLLPGVVLAAVPLAVIAVRVWPAWRETARLKGPAAATVMIISLLWGRVRHELGSALEDLRMLTGRHREGKPAAVPDAAPRKWAPVTRARNVPHLLDDPNLGAHPYPGEVAAGLDLAGVPVPPHWERTAQAIGEFEPETDDDMTGHMAEEAAGVLAAAAAVENRAENLALGRGLDPVLIEAHYDIAEGFAELAIRYALLVRRDHVLNGDLREWVENGGVLPHDARGYHQAGGPEDGGRTA